MRIGKREGYVSLLAVTFAFALATLGTVMVVSLRSYVARAAGQERALIDRISLDSAAVKILGELAAGGEHPIAPFTAPALTINGRSVVVETSLPEGKQDLAMDGADALIRDLDKAGLPNGIEALAGDKSRGLSDIARLAGLTADSEDCLRRRFTLGRAPEELEPLASVGSQSKFTRRATPGDQVDLRAAIIRGEREDILWVRARFTGVGLAWKIHEDRRLRFTSNEAC